MSREMITEQAQFIQTVERRAVAYMTAAQRAEEDGSRQNAERYFARADGLLEALSILSGLGSDPWDDEGEVGQ